MSELFNDYRGILEELVLIALENEIESLSDGWKIRANVRLRIDYERKIVYAIFTFQKEIEYGEKEPERYIAVDYNLNNVAFGDYERICIVKTNVGLITEKYADIMRRIQKKHLIGWRVKRPSRRGRNFSESSGGGGQIK